MNAQETKEVEEYLEPIWKQVKEHVFKIAEKNNSPIEHVRNYIANGLGSIMEAAEYSSGLG
jgi:hypothetical protein